MRFYFLLVLFCLMAVLSQCTDETRPFEVTSDKISIIPNPQSIKFNNGQFLLNQSSIIYADPELQHEASLLKESIHSGLGLMLPIEPLSEEELSISSIQLLLDKEEYTKESYALNIDNGSIKITGGSPQGLFHGIQTLLQILPKKHGSVSLPGLDIQDEPKFSHRGLLLDCCRHFWPVHVVKKYINLLAYYKMNVLHWHLTEDQGWRIEIKEYPKLTEVGSKRVESDSSIYGGFYTREDIKEIVAYATERHVTIIPEIEMPGHSLAALAAYPELACTDGPFDVTPEWGVFKDVYCAGDDHTFEFLENVLTEVVELFPGEYIHIGGDESPKYRWENCPRCQQRIKDEGLHDEHELQSYFIQRIERFLKSKGKKLIGWDEILEGGLSKTSIVQSWRGMQGGIDAANHGNYAIMSPTSHCYLDYDLDAIDLEKIYEFNPIPKELDPSLHSYILGGECNMWTEHVPTEKDLDSKILPRMIGLAEALWSAEKDYEGFSQRIKQHYPLLASWGYEYGFEKVPIAFSTEVKDQSIIVSVSRSDSNMEVHYTSNGTSPTNTSPKWIADSAFQKSTHLQVIASLEGRAYPTKFELPLRVHHALQKHYTTDQEYSPYYTAGGPSALTDGVAGTLNYRDGRWQGYQCGNLEVIIDLGELRTLEMLEAGFYQYTNAWIFFPLAIEVLGSEDGISFKKVAQKEWVHDYKRRGQNIETYQLEIAGTQTRYLKLNIETIGTCPDWHDAAGSPAWLFIDEIVVK